uniref:Uncharacterized protein n=1 Tax=Ditylenchus dipsaci TaxID=166011 RepID=A0A915CZA8_9BILA
MSTLYKASTVLQDSNLYNPYILFWLGSFMLAYTLALTVPVLFITLDRCFTIQFLLQYNNRKRTGFLEAAASLF